MQTYKRSTNQVSGGAGLLMFLPFVFIALIASVIVFLIIAAIYALTPMQSWMLAPIAVAVSLLCVFAAGFIAGKLGGSPGWLTGGITGAGYALILIIAGWVTGVTPLLSARPVLALFGCFIAGAIGGVFGINMKPKRRMGNW